MSPEQWESEIQQGEYLVIANVAKSRDGEEGFVQLRFIGYEHRFEEISLDAMPY